jgi:hypothetical protein
VRREPAAPPLLAQQPVVRPLVVPEAGARQAVAGLPAEWFGGACQVAAWPAGRWRAVVDRVAACVADVRG